MLLLPPASLHVESLYSVDDEARAVIGWHSDNQSLPCLYDIYWMSADSASYGHRKLTVSSAVSTYLLRRCVYSGLIILLCFHIGSTAYMAVGNTKTQVFRELHSFNLQLWW